MESASPKTQSSSPNPQTTDPSDPSQSLSAQPEDVSASDSHPGGEDSWVKDMEKSAGAYTLPEGEVGADDLGLQFGSEDSQGCQHWGLTPSQQRQERYARRLRKAVLFEKGENVDAVINDIRAELGESSVKVCVRLGNSNGKVALHMAAWRGDVESVKRLLELNAAIDAMTIRGQTSLHFAAGKKRDEVVELLLRQGARVRCRTAKGETPLELASKLGAAPHTVERLRQVEESDTRQWLDFQKVIRSRPSRRVVMGWLGTLVFSSGGMPEGEDEGEENEESENQPGGESNIPPEEMLMEDMVQIFVEGNARRMFYLIVGQAQAAMQTVKEKPRQLLRFLTELFREVATVAGVATLLQNLIGALDHIQPMSRPQRRAYHFLGSALPQAIRLLSDSSISPARPTKEVDFNEIRTEDGEVTYGQAHATKPGGSTSAQPMDFRSAIAELGPETVMAALYRARDPELGMNVAAALGLEPGESDQPGGKLGVEVGKTILEELAKRGDPLVCSRAARRLRMEWVLHEIGVFDMLIDAGYRQTLEQVGEAREGLREQVVDTLVKKECFKTASKLAERWGIPHKHLQERATLEELIRQKSWEEAWEYAALNPKLMQVLHDQHASDHAPPSNSGTAEEYLKMPANVRITWVQSEEDLEECWERLRNSKSTIVGVDTEWRHPRPCSLIQIATWEEAYLFDATKGDDNPDFMTLLSDFLVWLLLSDHHCKIGYAFEADLRRLATAFPALDAECVTVVDCQTIAPKTASKGLTGLCKMALGKGVDKAQQCSNWDRRPLKREQVEYAAMDAWVLLPLYEALLEMANQ